MLEHMQIGQTLQVTVDNGASFSNFAHEISHIILVNSGVKLAIKGAAAIDNLIALEKTGIEILACGPCLNHFKIADKPATGSASNMFTIFEVLKFAGRVLSP